MRWIRRALARIGALVRGHGRADADLRAEMQAHLEMEIAANLRRGMSPREARRRALVAAGGVEQAVEAVREERSLPWVEGFVSDGRYALRHFRRTPVATLTMVVVLSLGMGTVVGLLTVLSSLATLPAPGMARDASLVRIRGIAHIEGISGVQPRLLSWPEVEGYAGRTDLFGGVAAYADETALVRTAPSEPPVTASVIYTTPNYFDVLGVRPAIGTPPAGEGVPSALISHGLWRDRFGGARDVIGRTLHVNGFPVEIAGVAPPRFAGAEGGGRIVVWAPLAAWPLLQKRTTATFGSPDSLFLRAAGRLRPGVSTDRATSVVATMAERASPRDAERSRPTTHGADVVPMLAANARVSQRADLLVSGAASSGLVLLVLLITCTNVSALLVGSAVTRRGEVGLRLSLGAPRGRVIRQLLTESVLLAGAAAAVGLTVTAAALGLLDTAIPDMQLAVDWRVVLGTFAVALAAGILFGVSPALAATRVSAADVLKSASKSVAGGRSRLQRALIITQVALTQPLLVGLGVVIATMAADLDRDATSRAPDRIVEIELDPWAGRLSPDARSGVIDAAVARVAGMPGIVAAIPMQTGTITAPLTVPPGDRIAGVTPGTVMEAELTAAPEGYFDVYGIPLVRGRAFEPAERANASPDPASFLAATAIIIDAHLARRLWGDADPIGRRLAFGVGSAPDAGAMTVVGVVEGRGSSRARADGPVGVYVPWTPDYTGVVARTAGPALPMLNAMRQAVADEAPQAPILHVRTLAQREEEGRRAVIRASGAAGGGGLLALLLSGIGLYAVVSLGVGQRAQEIGIRAALGAQRSAIVGMFFLRGLALGAIGLALGLPLSIAVARLISTAVNMPVANPPLLGATIGLAVLAVASIASYIPARRASSIDPVAALRES